MNCERARVTVLKGSEMRYPSAVLFAALMVWGSVSPALACRGANNATIVKPSNDHVVTTGVDQYNIKLDPYKSVFFSLATGPSHDFGFCIDLSVLESSDLQNTTAGVMFWSAADDSNNAYFIQIRSDQYKIFRYLFDKTYELVPWTTEASIKKGLRQKNEVDVRVTATGADIQINGTALIPIVARPPDDTQSYGVMFQTPKTAAGSFQIEAPRIVK